jgi:hypothetical protein
MDQPKHLSQLKEQVLANSTKKVFIFNPTTENFTCQSAGTDVTINSFEAKEFDYFLAQHVKKHLLDFAFDKANGEKTREELLKEIEPNV